MIDWLEISHLAIAGQIQLEFGRSFTTVTGETGSGKSLIVGAIGLLLGDRCDNSMIRQSADSAQIQGSFLLEDRHPALAWLQQHELANDGECLLRRVIRRDKPSRGYINGHAVTATQLRTLGNELVDIHGQNEHHSLLNRSTQLALLDRSAGNEEAVFELATLYAEYSDIQREIERLSASSDNAIERADLLKFQLSELELLDPVAGEWPELESRQKRLQHQQELVSGAARLVELLSEADQSNINYSLSQCLNQLGQLTQYDPRLETIVQMLQEASVNIVESAGQLQQLYRSDSPDPQEIDRVEQRYSRYHELSRKHRVTPAELAGKLASLKTELSGLENPEKKLSHLEDLRLEKKRDYDKISRRIGKKRRHAAKALSTRVSALMQDLGLKGAALEISLVEIDRESVTRHGHESVEFLVSTNPGTALASMAKTASGGELSRISLAIQVILSEAASVSTLIFDEVDVGIGGKVAGMVGRKLRQLGESRQVICITHLSQVAAQGHAHWSVSKQAGKSLNVKVQPLSDAQRVEEIARMAAGAELTPESLAHAEQLLKSA